MLLLLLAPAFAGPPDVLHDDSVSRAVSGDCPGAEPGLLRRVDAYPDDLGARIILDACRFESTEIGTARTDLASLYGVTSPYDPSFLFKRRDAKPGDVARLKREAQLAVEMLVRAMVAKKRFEEAQTALAELEPQVGKSGPTAAARLLLEHGQNGVKAIWPLTTQTLDAWPEDLDVIEEVARVVFDDAAKAPAAVLDAIFARGHTSAKLNALLGLLRASRAPDCLLRADSFHVPEADQASLTTIVHRCAVAAGNLGRADSIVAAGTTGLEPHALAEHARLRMNAGRNADALELVEPLGAKDPGALGVVLEIYARTGQIDRIEELARKLPAGNTARLSAATTLVLAKQYGAALLLVEGTCTSYAAADATACERIVGAARRGLGM